MISVKENVYMLANNPINKKFLDSIQFTKDDIVILFNDSLFENDKSLKNAKRVLHFYRGKGGKTFTFWGFDKLKKCKCDKYFVTCDKMTNIECNIISEYITDNNVFYGFTDMFDKFGYTNAKKTPQAGTLVFQILKDSRIIKHDTNIYLVGFTSVYKAGLGSCHKKELEDNYFKEQQKEFTNLKYLNDHLK